MTVLDLKRWPFAAVNQAVAVIRSPADRGAGGRGEALRYIIYIYMIADV